MSDNRRGFDLSAAEGFQITSHLIPWNKIEGEHHGYGVSN